MLFRSLLSRLLPGAPHLRLTVPGLASSLGGMSEQISPTIRIGAGLPVLPPPSGV